MLARAGVQAAGINCVNGLGRAGGFLIGASEGAAFGLTDGLIRGGFATGTWAGALSQGLESGLIGFGIGGSLGALLHKVCFVAGTQVVTGVKVRLDDGRIVTISAKKLARMQKEAGRVAVKLQLVGYVTASIEDLQEGDWVISRDQHDSDGPLAASRISRKYRRIADHLQVVGIQDAAGLAQTLFTTDEHPFHVPARSWVKSRLLEVGDGLTGPTDAASRVTATARQSHPEGVVVYNMEVEGTHTYFVRAQGSDAEPIWVHNAHSYPDTARDYVARKQHRATVAQASFTAHGGKHTVATSVAEAISMSSGPGGIAQYLPGISNRGLERLAAQLGLVRVRAKVLEFYYDAGTVVGYDRGEATRFVYAEISSGNLHGRPMSPASMPASIRQQLGL